MKYGNTICCRGAVGAGPSIAAGSLSSARPRRSKWTSGRGDRQQAGYPCECAVVPSYAATPCGSRHGKAERPTKDIRCHLRGDTRSDGLFGRKLLPERSRGMLIGLSTTFVQWDQRKTPQAKGSHCITALFPIFSMGDPRCRYTACHVMRH